MTAQCSASFQRKACALWQCACVRVCGWLAGWLAGWVWMGVGVLCGCEQFWPAVLRVFGICPLSRSPHSEPKRDRNHWLNRSPTQSLRGPGEVRWCHMLHSFVCLCRGGFLIFSRSFEAGVAGQGHSASPRALSGADGVRCCGGELQVKTLVSCVVVHTTHHHHHGSQAARAGHTHPPG
jgi:hypothetical protein